MGNNEASKGYLMSGSLTSLVIFLIAIISTIIIKPVITRTIGIKSKMSMSTCSSYVRIEIRREGDTINFVIIGYCYFNKRCG
jgi:hypothetical protein